MARRARSRDREFEGIPMSDEPSKEIRVPADAFEYTRDGLATRDSLDLQVGTHNRIVVVRPKPETAVHQGARGFSQDSAFPLPATLAIFWSLCKVGTPFTHHTRASDRAGRTAFQVYGHASASGDEAHNKQLSERRAQVGLALLTSDAQALSDIADEDGWGDQEAQAMLRTLACNPGPADGEPGPRTGAAVAQFQSRYNRDVYHRPRRAQRTTELSEDGELDAPTRKALLEAFVLAHGGNVATDRVHPTHSANGCSEYNLASDDGPDSRRIVLVGHTELPRYSENAPCTVGDEKRCAVVDDAQHRCLWYREHVAEQSRAPVVFHDPRWLWLGDDRYFLSALTNLDEGADVDFEVYDAPKRSNKVLGKGSFSRSTVLSGVVRCGIAEVVWKCDNASSTPDGRPDFDGFPVFQVRDPATGSSALAPWPETGPLAVVVLTPSRDSLEEADFSYRLVTDDGAYEQLRQASEAKPASSRHAALQFDDVPLDSRITVSMEVQGQPILEVLSHVVAGELPGNCTSGSQCVDVPPPTAPPAPPAADELDEDGDRANPWLAGDPSDFEEPLLG